MTGAVTGQDSALGCATHPMRGQGRLLILSWRDRGALSSRTSYQPLSTSVILSTHYGHPRAVRSAASPTAGLDSRRTPFTSTHLHTEPTRCRPTPHPHTLSAAPHASICRLCAEPRSLRTSPCPGRVFLLLLGTQKAKQLHAGRTQFTAHSRPKITQQNTLLKAGGKSTVTEMSLSLR